MNRTGRRLRFVAAAVALMVSVAWGLADAEAAKKKAGKPRASFFHTKEIRSTNLKPFKKWTSALKRYSKEKLKKSGKCTQPGLDICNYGQWKAFLEPLKKKGKIAQLKAVNNRMNKARYIQDASNWGKKDYWASPAQFMARFGDCEDYAIVKYLSLRYLGWKERDLRVVAVKDLNLKVGHAVLVAFIKDKKTKKKRAVVLDNQIKKVVYASSIRHYQPVFSINKRFWWRHVS